MPAKLTREDIVLGVQNGTYKNIVFMCGAGISVAAGIPDFRSPGTGLYANLQKYNLPHPEAVFELSYFKSNPAPFYTLARELFPRKLYHPTLAHFFMVLVQKKGLLTHIYTQNVDCLEFEAGLTDDDVLCAHGSFRTARVLETGESVDVEIVRESISKGEVCYHNGKLVKPDIVFFGEGLPRKFFEFRKHFEKADLLIVMGTSLAVQPFANLVEVTRDNVPRVLFNRESVGPFCRPCDTDVQMLGDLESEVVAFAEALGWKEELFALQKAYQISLTPAGSVASSSSDAPTHSNSEKRGVLEIPADETSADTSSDSATTDTEKPLAPQAAEPKTNTSVASDQSATADVLKDGDTSGQVAPQVDSNVQETPKPPPPARLRRAILAGNISEVEELIKKGVDVNGRVSGGVSGSKVNGRTVAGESTDLSLLDVAVDERQTKILGLLLEAGANPSNSDSQGGDALQLAAQNGYLAGIELLLKYGANPNSTDHQGGSALLRAAENGNPECVAALLAAGANVNARGHTIGGTPLYWAALGGFTEAAQLLLEAGADPSIKDNSGRTALEIVRDIGYVDMANLLANARSSPAVVSYDAALQICVISGNIPGVKVLLEEGSGVDSLVEGALAATGKAPLLVHAIRANQTEMVKFLLENGADANKSDEAGKTPLMTAAELGAVEAVKLLLQCKVDENARNTEGQTALELAITKGKEDVAQILSSAA